MATAKKSIGEQTLSQVLCVLDVIKDDIYDNVENLAMANKGEEIYLNLIGNKVVLCDDFTTNAIRMYCEPNTEFCVFDIDSTVIKLLKFVVLTEFLHFQNYLNNSTYYSCLHTAYSVDRILANRSRIIAAYRPE